jgi:hypothetical protein
VKRSINRTRPQRGTRTDALLTKTKFYDFGSEKVLDGFVHLGIQGFDPRRYTLDTSTTYGQMALLAGNAMTASVLGAVMMTVSGVFFTRTLSPSSLPMIVPVAHTVDESD